MDLLDKKILCELDMNCRQTASRIAKAVGSSRAVVGYRIANFEKAGIINAYPTSINLGRLGYSTYKIYFKLFNLDEKAEKEFYNFMKAEKKVIHCLKTEGAFDVSAVVAVDSIKNLDDFLMLLKNRFSQIIKDYQISIVVSSRIFKLSKILFEKPAKEPKAEKYSGITEKIVIDDTDKAILEAIADNARMPIVEIASKTGLSIDIVKYRMKKLVEQNVINSFRVILEMGKMGFYHYVILLKTRKASKEDEDKIQRWAAMHPSLMYLTKRIGNWDYELNVALKDIDDFNRFLADMKRQFSSVIESYDTIMNTAIIKLKYLPF